LLADISNLKIGYNKTPETISTRRKIMGIKKLLRGQEKVQLLIIALGLLILFGGCSLTRHRQINPVVDLAGGTPKSVRDQVASLEEMKPPGGVSEEVFSQIKKELIKRLEGADKVTSAPAKGAGSAVNDLRIELSAGQPTLYWTYKNQGDVNVDGIVDISDIGPIAEHFFHKRDESSQQFPHPEDEIIDINGDGEINIADVAPLAENFFGEVYEYAIMTGKEAGGIFFPFDRIYMYGRFVPGRIERIVLSYPFGAVRDYMESNGDRYLAVVPRDQDGRGGVASTLIDIQAIPPTISKIKPLRGKAGTSVTFSAEVFGSEPIEYLWDFSDAGTPSSSTEPNPTINLGAIGEYLCRLDVSNAYGSDSEQFTFRVTEEAWEIVDGPEEPGLASAPTCSRFAPDGKLSTAYWFFDWQAVQEILRLRFAQFDGANWTTQTVDEGPDYPPHYGPSLDFDLSGLPAFSYEGISDYTLNFARFDGSNWNIESVPETVEVTHSVLSFNGENPEIVYAEYEGGIFVASFDGAQWNIDTMEAPSQFASAGWFDALRLPDNTLVVAYQRNRYPPVGGETSEIIVATRGETGWTKERVVEYDLSVEPLYLVGPAIELDNEGKPVVCYGRTSFYYEPLGTIEISLARKTGDTWNIEQFQGEGIIDPYSSSTSQALDLLMLPNGEPLIFYAPVLIADYQVVSAFLKSAYKVNGEWVNEDIDEATYSVDGISATLDPEGKPVVSYVTTNQEELGGTLKIAWLR